MREHWRSCSPAHHQLSANKLLWKLKSIYKETDTIKKEISKATESRLLEKRYRAYTTGVKIEKNMVIHMYQKMHKESIETLIKNFTHYT